MSGAPAVRLRLPAGGVPAGESRTGARAVWRHRELLRSLTERNLKVKYQRSLLGFVWTLLNPIATVAVLAVVFSTIVRIQMEDYLVFLLSGYFVWNCLSQIISSGTFVLAEHGQLMRSVAFPKDVPVVASALSRLIEFGVELLLVLGAVVVMRHGAVPVSFVLVPWLLVLLFAMALGLVLPIAALSIFYRDVQHALPLVLTTLFYLSPVFYPASMVPEMFRIAFLINPIAQLLTVWHVVVYDGAFPSLGLAAVVTVVSFGLLWMGYAIFNRYEARFAEVV